MASESQYVPFMLEELDYHAQFLAIRNLLYTHEQERKHLHEEIEEMREFADITSGDANWMAADEWAGLCHRSCYQDAAHSMAAVGNDSSIHRIGVSTRISTGLGEDSVWQGIPSGQHGREGHDSGRRCGHYASTCPET